MKFDPARMKRGGINLTIILILFLNTTPFLNLPLIESVDRILYDMRLRATMPDDLDERVIIVDVDEKSITELGHWPWNRNILADLVSILFDGYQINTLGFDMVFAEADESSALEVMNYLDETGLNDPRYLQLRRQLIQEFQYDVNFAEAIRDRKVVMGMVFDQTDSQAINNLGSPLAELETETAEALRYANPKGYTANLNILQSGAAGVGFFDNPVVEPDGIYRRIPLLQLYGDKLYPSLALAVSQVAFEQPVAFDIEQSQEYTAIDKLQIGSNIIPLDIDGSVLVPYRARGSFRYVSVIDVLRGDVDPELLRNKIVLLGTSAPGLMDLRPSPIDTRLPGVEVHANLITGIWDMSIPYRPGYLMSAELLVIAVLGFLMMVVCCKLSPMMMILFTGGLSVGYTALNLWYWKQGTVLFLASPLLLLLMTFIVHMSWGFLVENRSKRMVTKLFGQYIPPDLVDEMVAKPELSSLEGQSRELTVLFADVRGFTTISESLSPDELSQLLNDLLTPMTEVIYNTRGTIDKYMGDAIMAFWGAPVPHDNHAELGVKAALQKIERLNELQPEFKAKGWPEINMGIGLNTGKMSVGNMGSEYRMAYTILGDAVNLGSRLEGLTKQYGVAILVSEFTKAAAPMFVYRELDLVRVKGKDKAVKIYEAVGEPGGVSDEELHRIKQFEEAIEAYRAQHWDNAENIIHRLLSESGDRPLTVLYKMYLERIKAYREQSPGADWDGVFVHTSK